LQIKFFLFKFKYPKQFLYWNWTCSSFQSSS
jgi:hypothetical protein